jgi:hypothetical protein
MRSLLDYDGDDDVATCFKRVYKNCVIIYMLSLYFFSTAVAVKFIMNVCDQSSSQLSLNEREKKRKCHSAVRQSVVINNDDRRYTMQKKNVYFCAAHDRLLFFFSLAILLSKYCHVKANLNAEAINHKMHSARYRVKRY